MGFVHVPVSVRPANGDGPAYTAQFLADSGSLDSMVPASELVRIGIKPIGLETFVFADGSRRQLPFGAALIEIMGKVTAGRVVFAPEGSEPLLGVAPLQSAGFAIDPVNHTLRTIRLRLG